MKTVLKNTHSKAQQDLNTYLISYGSKFALNKIEIFYSVECGLSREFIQKDLLKVFELFHNNITAQIILYPVGLDKMTLSFAEKTRNMNNLQKLEILLTWCQEVRNLDDFDKMDVKLMEEIFFDIEKILESHEDITETLMVKINDVVMTDVPSVYAIQKILHSYY